MQRLVAALLLALACDACLPASSAAAASHHSTAGRVVRGHPPARLQQRNFMRGLASAAKAQVIAGTLAGAQGSTAEVRAFGRQLAASRQRTGRRLSLLSLHNQVPIPSRPARSDDAMIARLRPLRGEAFDVAFLQEFGVELQERELSLCRSALAADGDAGLRKFAQQTARPIREQLGIARKLLAAARSQSAQGEQVSRPQGEALQVPVQPGAGPVPGAGPAWATEESDALQGVTRAAEVLRTMKQDPRMEALLNQARGVLVFTQYRRGGLLVGARAGKGLLVTRHGDGLSAPAFFGMQGASIGLQAGAATGATVYLLMTDAAVRQFRSPRAFSVDAFAAATLGPNAQQWHTSTGKVTDLVAWSGTRGAYAGAAFGMNRIVPDVEANRAYYGRSVSVSEILGGLVRNPHGEVLGSLLGP